MSFTLSFNILSVEIRLGNALTERDIVVLVCKKNFKFYEPELRVISVRNIMLKGFFYMANLRRYFMPYLLF